MKNHVKKIRISQANIDRYGYNLALFMAGFIALSKNTVVTNSISNPKKCEMTYDKHQELTLVITPNTYNKDIGFMDMYSELLRKVMMVLDLDYKTFSSMRGCMDNFHVGKINKINGKVIYKDGLDVERVTYTVATKAEQVKMNLLDTLTPYTMLELNGIKVPKEHGRRVDVSDKIRGVCENSIM